MATGGTTPARPLRLTAKGHRWLTRWNKARHLAGWTFILLACVAVLVLFGMAANAIMSPHFARFH